MVKLLIHFNDVTSWHLNLIMLLLWYKVFFGSSLPIESCSKISKLSFESPDWFGTNVRFNFISHHFPFIKLNCSKCFLNLLTLCLCSCLLHPQSHVFCTSWKTQSSAWFSTSFLHLSSFIPHRTLHLSYDTYKNLILTFYYIFSFAVF